MTCNRLMLLVCALVAFAANESVRGAIFFADGFNYANGDLTDVDINPTTAVTPGANVSGGKWNDHSGGNQVDSITVVNGQAELVVSGSEDANRTVADPVGGAMSAGTWYFAAELTVNDIRPVGSAEGVRNEYFIHFKDSTTQNFVTRVYLADPSTGPGTPGFRFGLAATTGGQTDVWPTNLNFGQEYTIVGSYNFDTGASQLWVDPADPSSPSIVSAAPDAVGPGTFVNALAIRQAFIPVVGNPPTLPANRPNTQILLDAVAMGDDFAQVLAVLPEPTSGMLALAGIISVMASRRRR